MDKFNYEDWDIEPETETGNDDIIYGNYFDWDEFRQLQEENLLSSFEVYLPWDEELYLSEYWDFLRQEVFENTSIVEDWELDKLKILTQGNDISDIVIQFPTRNESNSNDIVSAIFDYFEVPSGTDFEQELPENLQYWYSMSRNDYLENEYEYYRKYPLKFITYEQTISDIESKVLTSPDNLTKKSLLLSSFIISESLLKSAIASTIPEETIISDFSKNILSTGIERMIQGSVDQRNQIFKKLFNEKAPEQGWVNLRNSLAHDIEASTIQDNRITYTNLRNDTDYTISIGDLFTQQKNFYKELQQIIDKQKESAE